MRIKSPAFEEGKEIPQVYTCQGKNINPPLEFYDIPESAKSLVLIMDDPDAPNGTFLHWLAWNISPNISKFDEGIVPKEIEQGLNGAGKKGYLGPCPPSGTHRYFFKLYAINKKLSVYPGVTKKELEHEINNSLIEKAQLIGMYQKK